MEKMNKLTIELDTSKVPSVSISKEVPMSDLSLEERLSTANLDNLSLLEAIITLNEYIEKEFGISAKHSLDTQIQYLQKAKNDRRI